MSDTVTIGKRLIPLEHVALVEPFDPASAPDLKSARSFQARVVLIGRESLLAEQAPIDFVRMHGFRMLTEEGVAINPSVRFAVETFEPTEGFKPEKPYRSRLLWHDRDGNTQSKLLLSTPEVALAIAVTGETDAAPVPEGEDAKAPRETAKRTRRQPKQPAAEATPT